MEEQPLVSIIVITYNSSNFVLETLESAKEQTYQNIELIISDDASQDVTVEICQRWLKENKDRFVRIDLITVKENTGIPANCNRGVKASEGEWVKMIAGDDALYFNTIENYVNYINENKSSLVNSYSARYNETFQESNYIRKFPSKVSSCFNVSKDKRSCAQFETLLITNIINAPTTFMKKSAILSVGGFDEEFPLIEDHPMWLRLTKRNYYFDFMPKVTVKHRIHSGATYSYYSKAIFKESYFKKEKFKAKYIYPELTWTAKNEMKFACQIRHITNALKLNINNPFCRTIDFILTKAMNPFTYLRKIKKYA